METEYSRLKHRVYVLEMEQRVLSKKLELACNYLSTVLSMGKTYYTKVEQQVIFGGYLKSLNQLNSGKETGKAQP